MQDGVRVVNNFPYQIAINFHCSKWIFFAFSTFAIIEQITFAEIWWCCCWALQEKWSNWNLLVINLYFLVRCPMCHLYSHPSADGSHTYAISTNMRPFNLRLDFSRPWFSVIRCWLKGRWFQLKPYLSAKLRLTRKIRLYSIFLNLMCK